MACRWENGVLLPPEEKPRKLSFWCEVRKGLQNPLFYTFRWFLDFNVFSLVLTLSIQFTIILTSRIHATFDIGEILMVESIKLYIYLFHTGSQQSMVDKCKKKSFLCWHIFHYFYRVRSRMVLALTNLKTQLKTKTNLPAHTEKACC